MGAKTYAGRPCRLCEGVERYVTGGACVPCKRARGRAAEPGRALKRPSRAKPPRPKKTHKRLQKHESLIYFIRAGEFVKVGITTGLHERMHAMQTNSAHELSVLHTMPGGFQREAELHELLRPYHFRGEWYRLTGDLAKFLELVGVQ